MDVEALKVEIAKLIKYGLLANNVSDEEYADTVGGFWMHLENNMEPLSDDEREEIYRFIDNSLGTEITGRVEMFFLTVLLYHYMDGKYADRLIERAMSKNVDYGCFTYQQLDSFNFLYPNVIDTDSLNRLYYNCLEIWKDAVREECESIEIGENDKYLIITNHFVGPRHAPSKTLLERVDTLKREMNKDVFVIHSRETLSFDEVYPFYDWKKGSVTKSIDGLVELTEDETSFYYYQTPHAMPNLNELLECIRYVKSFNPGRIIIMGEHCILSDILADYIPSVLISFGFSVLRPVYNQYAALFRKMTDDDRKQIIEWGCDENRYICGTFTFRFIEQNSTITRAELGIPEDAFVFTTIGNRLGTDLTDEFLEMLGKLEGNWHYALAGNMKDGEYETICEKYPFMKEKSTFVGYMKDILAFLDICDLYVNPPRLGGGFSVAEAFSKGKPGVSNDFGDVAAAAGDDFLVNSLEEMSDTIRKYMTDKSFYDEMKEKALLRAKKLTDSKAALEEILDEFNRRVDEQGF